MLAFMISAVFAISPERADADDSSLQADDELENPILAGFEWDKEESWTRLIVHQKKAGAPSSGKKKGKKGEE